MNRTAVMSCCGAAACCIVAVTSLAAWNPGRHVLAEALATGYPGLPLAVALALVIVVLALSRLGSNAKMLAVTATGVLLALACAGTLLLALGDVVGDALSDEKVVRVERARSADGDFELVSTGRHRLDWNDHKYGYTVVLRSRAGLLSRQVTVLSVPFTEAGEPRPGSMGFTGRESFQIDGRHYAFDRDRLTVRRR